MARKPRLIPLIRSVVDDSIHRSQPDLAFLARELGALVHTASDGRYLEQLNGLRSRAKGFSRWLISDSKRPPYSAFLLVWPPGHVTPLNELRGRWGMELVIQGSLEVQEYQLSDDGLAPTRKRMTWLGESDAIWFDRDQHCAHRGRNLSSQQAAITLHLAGARQARYRLFERVNESVWNVRSRIASINGRLTM